MGELTRDQIDEIKDVFMMYDVNQDGHIDRSELRTVLRELGQDPTEATLTKMIADAESSTPDSLRNGKIEFSEFLDMVEREGFKSQTQQEDSLIQAFRVFDKDNNGFITSEELKHCMAHLGDPMTDAEIKEMMAQADQDGNGVVNYAEFVKVMAAR